MWPQVIYLVLALVVFGSSAFAMNRYRRPGSQGPGLLMSLLIWAGVIALVVIIYQGANFWSALGSLFR